MNEPKTNGRTILIVDDEDSVCSFLKTILKAEGYRTLVAQDGRQAIEIAERGSVDGILLDLMMPNLSGETTLRFLRRLEPCRNTPVIVITAKDGDAPVVETTVAGADAYLHKPFEPEIVISLLRRLVA